MSSYGVSFSSSPTNRLSEGRKPAAATPIPAALRNSRRFQYSASSVISEVGISGGRVMSMTAPWGTVNGCSTLKIRRQHGSGSRHGQGGIRTLDTLASMPPFQGGAFNHSATCPEALPGGNLAGCERKINVSQTGE